MAVYPVNIYFFFKVTPSARDSLPRTCPLGMACNKAQIAASGLQYRSWFAAVEHRQTTDMLQFAQAVQPARGTLHRMELRWADCHLAALILLYDLRLFIYRLQKQQRSRSALLTMSALHQTAHTLNAQNAAARDVPTLASCA